MPIAWLLKVVFDVKGQLSPSALCIVAIGQKVGIVSGSSFGSVSGSDSAASVASAIAAASSTKPNTIT